MKINPKDLIFPVLGGVITQKGNLHVEVIRELTCAEQEKITEYTKKGAHARNRFKLFAILRRNYEQWWDYTRSLLTPGDDLAVDEMLELDRLLMNFQSSAKSVVDHFKQDWIQQFRGSPEEAKFKEFLERLEQGSWAFAFFQDLRNFTQHCGLPVGNYSRNSTTNSVSLKVEADPEWLINHYNRWEKSKLTKDKGQLDLIDLTREYFLYLHRDFGSFVAKAFAPDLLVVHNFFAELANEVTNQHPQAEFKIITSIEMNGNKLNFQFKTPPANLLGWIGISVNEVPTEEPRAEQAETQQPPLAALPPTSPVI